MELDRGNRSHHDRRGVGDDGRSGGCVVAVSILDPKSSVNAPRVPEPSSREMTEIAPPVEEPDPSEEALLPPEHPARANAPRAHTQDRASARSFLAFIVRHSFHRRFVSLQNKRHAVL